MHRRVLCRLDRILNQVSSMNEKTRHLNTSRAAGSNSSTTGVTQGVLQMRDDQGRGIDLAKYQEVVHPIYMDIPSKLKKVKDFKYAEGDVMLCAYPKSGNHWMSAMLYLLLHAKSHEEIMTGKVQLLPFIDLYSTKKIAAQPRPRSIVSHLQYHRLPAEHAQKDAKIILMVRNPKDVAVSLYHHMKNQDEFLNPQSWDGFLRCFMKGEVLFGSYWDYVTSWQRVITERRHTNLIVVYYEDLVQNCLRELQRVRTFLGVERTDDDLRQIERRCRYGNMRASLETGTMDTTARDVKGEAIILRKGQIGDWMTHFTPEQNEAFDQLIKEKLGESIFNVRYEETPPRPKL